MRCLGQILLLREFPTFSRLPTFHSYCPSFEYLYVLHFTHFVSSDRGSSSYDALEFIHSYFLVVLFPLEIEAKNENLTSLIGN